MQEKGKSRFISVFLNLRNIARTRIPPYPQSEPSNATKLALNIIDLGYLAANHEHTLEVLLPQRASAPASPVVPADKQLLELLRMLP